MHQQLISTGRDRNSNKKTERERDRSGLSDGAQRFL